MCFRRQVREGNADTVYALLLLVLKEAVVVILPVFIALYIVGFASQALKLVLCLI